MKRTRTSTRKAWLPAQHGAWAMLVVATLIGWRLAYQDRSLGWIQVLVTATWLAGYLGMHAWGVWFKAPGLHRRRYTAPMLVYGSASAILGLASLILTRGSLLWWAGFLAIPIAITVWATIAHAERTLLSRFASILAVAEMILVLRFPDPGEVIGQWPQCQTDLIRAGLVFGYFFGTVFYVKTLIRERGQLSWRIASASYHLVCLVTTLGLMVLGSSPYWIPVFAGLTLRSVVVPWWAHRHRLAPAPIGFGEIGFSLLVLAVAWV